MTYLKQHLLPILLILLGIIDQSTDLLMQLMNEVNAPSYAPTVFRIIIITLGSIKLYLSNANKLNGESR
jgi:hypothetical protein